MTAVCVFLDAEEFSFASGSAIDKSKAVATGAPLHPHYQAAAWRTVEAHQQHQEHKKSTKHRELKKQAGGLASWGELRDARPTPARAVHQRR